MLQTFTLQTVGRQIDAAGQFFRYESAAGYPVGADLSLRVIADGNDLGTYLPTDDVELPERVKRWNLVPVNASLPASFVATVRIGIGRVRSNRNGGVVSVVDNSAELVSYGKQFFGTYAKGAVVGQFSICGMRANAFPLSIRRLSIACDVATLVTIYACTGDPTSVPNNQAGFGKNKLILTGATSSCRGISGEAAAAVPTGGELPGVLQQFTLLAGANIYTELILSRPLYLAAGTGLVAVPNVVNRQVYWAADFEELT